MTRNLEVKVTPLTEELILDSADEQAIEALNRKESQLVLLAPAAQTLRLYLAQPQALAKILPLLANLGLSVQSQATFTVSAGEAEYTVFELGVEESVGAALELVQEGLEAVLSAKADDDELNQLILAQALPWHSVLVLRAYASYLAQLGLRLSRAQVAAIYLANPKITSQLIELFETGFDPARNLTSEERIQQRTEISSRIEEELKNIADLDTDRFLRAVLEVSLATVRTNLYQNKETLAFKLRPTQISLAPLPRPMWEIWVYSPKVEGTHLRFGMVSRGGLRWSDRGEDFRTEILGLVKAQRVKNAVIIPNGSKGGFFPKGLPDRDSHKEAYASMGLEAYKLFIGSLLDVTDNLVLERGQEKIVQPDKVVILDEPDHYLVVAADKGTATFSDTANALSQERGFWLGDAFASGGSVGFDHKEMGITARGAWESVKRHFASMGHSSQSEDFTMVGIGGMAGDVFGNGALLSEHIRLVAAFDSRHIFIDPNPDAASSYAERKRLFELPRPYWTDYNPELISEGGGVFNRSDKAVTLNPQIRQALGLEGEEESLTPQELIRAIIAAPVDLLYTGGTGTYVRSSQETDAEVADRTNDQMRITAPELRVKVISEGGNLGLTQQARIEAASLGILVNTDAVDNSAGVETSDHEVNLKILIDRLIASGQLDASQREELIQAQVQEVGRQVLQSNINQNILLQSERLGTRPTNSAASRFISFLEKNAGLDRQVEFLPSAEQLQQRRQQGQRLTSPELSVLSAYSKIWLTQALLEEGLGQDPWFEPVLRDYFPSQVAAQYGQYFWSHPLRQQIIATRVANEIVDTAGIVFVFRVIEETGASIATVARAFMVVRDTYGLQTIMQQLRDLGPKTDPELWRSLILGIQRFTDRAVRKVVQEGSLAQAQARGQVEGVMDRLINHYRQVGQLSQRIPDFLGGSLLERVNNNLDLVKQWEVPDEISHAWARVWEEVALLDILDIAAATGWQPEQVAPLYFALYERFNVSTMLLAISDLPRTGRWESMSRAFLRSDLYEAVTALTKRLIFYSDRQEGQQLKSFEQAAELVQSWQSAHPVLLARFERSKAMANVLGRFARQEEAAEFATIAVAVRNLREIAGAYTS